MLNCVVGVAGAKESTIEIVAVIPGGTLAKNNTLATNGAMNGRSFLIWVWLFIAILLEYVRLDEGAGDSHDEMTGEGELSTM